MATYGTDLKITILPEGVEKLLKISKEMRQVSEGTQKANKDLAKLQERLRTLESLRGAFQGLNMAGIQMMGVSYGIVRAFKGIGKSVLGPAVEMQGFHNTLVTLYKDEKKATEMLEWAKTAAAKTPFEVRQVIDATTQFKAFGVDAKKWMTVAGDTAAAMNKDFNATSYAIAKTAAVGAAGMDILRESYGITTDMIKKFGWSGVKSDLEGFRNALYKLLTTRYEGGMERYMNTLPGIISNFRDKVYEVCADVGKPIRELLEKDLGNLLKKINELAKTGQLTKWAKVLSDMLKGVYDFAKTTIGPLMKFAERHPAAAKWVGTLSALTAVVTGAGGAFLFLTGMIGQAVTGMISLNTQLAIMRAQSGGIRGALPGIGRLGAGGAGYGRLGTVGGLMGPVAAVGAAAGYVMEKYAAEAHTAQAEQSEAMKRVLEKEQRFRKALFEARKTLRRTELKDIVDKARAESVLTDAITALRIQKTRTQSKEVAKAAGAEIKVYQDMLKKVRRLAAGRGAAAAIGAAAAPPAPELGAVLPPEIAVAAPAVENYYITQRFQRDSVVIQTTELTPEDFIRYMKQVARQEALR